MLDKKIITTRYNLFLIFFIGIFTALFFVSFIIENIICLYVSAISILWSLILIKLNL
jgi:hypothetical protein